jgi:predicted DNA-binding transcriptional regulator AlpA
MDQLNQTNSPSSLEKAVSEVIRQAVLDAVNTGGPKHETPPEGRLLTVDEAAVMLSMSPDWLYRHAKKLPFAMKVGRKALRFSHQGILKWLESRKLSQ